MATRDLEELTWLGDGPVATVYSGRHQGMPVALKVFPGRLDKRTTATFTHEQSILAGLRRVASILPVDGVQELATGGLAMRMELCTQSLAQMVERAGPLNIADALVICRAVALALAAGHRAGVPHGGMSPHNVLFRATGEPLLSDFGAGMRRAVAGYPPTAVDYLAPETLRSGVRNERSDVYGLGAVVYFALSGRPPYPRRLGEQPGERIERILNEPVPDVLGEDVPVALAALVVRLLATDPVDRPRDAAEVADQLCHLLPGSLRESNVDEFDDFAAPAREQPSRTLPPPAPIIVSQADDALEFDDFAMPSGPPG